MALDTGAGFAWGEGLGMAVVRDRKRVRVVRRGRRRVSCIFSWGGGDGWMGGWEALEDDLVFGCWY